MIRMMKSERTSRWPRLHHAPTHGQAASARGHVWLQEAIVWHKCPHQVKLLFVCWPRLIFKGAVQCWRGAPVLPLLQCLLHCVGHTQAGVSILLDFPLFAQESNVTFRQSCPFPQTVSASPRLQCFLLCHFSKLLALLCVCVSSHCVVLSQRKESNLTVCWDPLLILFTMH